MLRVTPARRSVSARKGKPPTLGRPAMARSSAACRFSIALLTKDPQGQVASIKVIPSVSTLAIDWRVSVRLPRRARGVDFLLDRVPRPLILIGVAAVEGLELSLYRYFFS